jgi:hypothetical protein
VRTRNPRACVTVNFKCVDSDSVVLPVVSSCVNKVPINPIIPSKTPSVVTNTRTRDSIFCLPFLMFSLRLIPYSFILSFRIFIIRCLLIFFPYDPLLGGMVEFCTFR